jgi:hypothetical protein
MACLGTTWIDAIPSIWAPTKPSGDGHGVLLADARVVVLRRTQSSIFTAQIATAAALAVNVCMGIWVLVRWTASPSDLFRSHGALTLLVATTGVGILLLCALLYVLRRFYSLAKTVTDQLVLAHGDPGPNKTG